LNKNFYVSDDVEKQLQKILEEIEINFNNKNTKISNFLEDNTIKFLNLNL
jgi:hypothetical protein